MSVTVTKQDAVAIRVAITDGYREVAHGYVYLIRNDLHEAPYALLEDLFVAEDARREGHGRTLLAAMIAEAKHQGCYKITAQSRYEKEEIHAWYLRAGFEDYGKNFRMNL